MKPIAIQNRQAKLIAHRGLSSMEHENTAAAYVAAGNRNYFGIEADVHVTESGQFLMIHDHYVTDQNGFIVPVEQLDDTTYKQIRFSDGNVIRGDLCIPLLEDYLTICNKYGKIAVLELKNCFSSSAIDDLLKQCLAVLNIPQIIFISFVWDNLTAIRNQLPDAQIQFLYKHKPSSSLIKQLAQCSFDIDIAYDMLTPALIASLHEAEITINCWTCDDPAVAEQLALWGVDQITTNCLLPKEREV